MKRAMSAAMVVMASVAMAGDRVIRLEYGSVFDWQPAVEARFGEIAALAKEIGCTHVDVSRVEPAIWMWDLDRTDPYLNWMINRPGVFRFVVPEKLRPYVEMDGVARNRARLAERSKILSEFGLKPSFWCYEPQSLPERAYGDHPNWRGGRCDHPYRSRGEHYAPCIDDVEMRGLYVEAIAEICAVAPIERFALRTNNAGSGLCWWRFAYPGENGPTHCKSIPFGERAASCMAMFQEGAAKAGLSATVDCTKGFRFEDVASALRAGQFVGGRGVKGNRPMVTVEGNAFPLIHPSRLLKIAGQMQTAQARRKADIGFVLSDPDSFDEILFLKKFAVKPIGPLASDRLRALEETAADIVGLADAGKLVRAWELTERAFEAIGDVGIGFMQAGTVHQRWLTRPLVAFPAELTADEKGYYRPFLFQARGERQAEDLINLQGDRFLAGYAGQEILHRLRTRLGSVFGEINRICKTLTGRGEPERRYLETYALSMRVLRLIVRNAANVVRWQYALDEISAFGARDSAADIDCRARPQLCRGDRRSRILQAVMRDEEEMAGELIALLDAAERAGIRLFVAAHAPEFENIMVLPHDMRPHLRRKIEIMRRHHGDLRRLLEPADPANEHIH